MNDCYLEDTDIECYESANDRQLFRLGLTYFKINPSVEGHVKIYSRFKTNLTEWVTVLFPNRLIIIERMDEEINWELALKDAKAEQGLTRQYD
jgi:hypothetical protein